MNINYLAIFIKYFIEYMIYEYMIYDIYLYISYIVRYLNSPDECGKTRLDIRNKFVVK